MRDHSLCVACYSDDSIEKPKQAYYDHRLNVQYATCLMHMRKLKVGKFKQFIQQNGEDYSKW
jgi:hypothetical protein